MGKCLVLQVALLIWWMSEQNFVPIYQVDQIFIFVSVWWTGGLTLLSLKPSLQMPIIMSQNPKWRHDMASFGQLCSYQDRLFSNIFIKALNCMLMIRYKMAMKQLTVSRAGHRLDTTEKHTHTLIALILDKGGGISALWISVGTTMRFNHNSRSVFSF